MSVADLPAGSAAPGGVFGDPERLRDAARVLSATADAMDAATTTAQALIEAAVPAAWSGTAATACSTAQQQLAVDGRALTGALQETAAALATLAEALADAQAAHHRAHQEASGLTASLRDLAAGPPVLRAHAADLSEQRAAALGAAEAARAQALQANLQAAAAFARIAGAVPRPGRLGAPCQARTVTRTTLWEQILTGQRGDHARSWLLVGAGLQGTGLLLNEPGTGVGKQGGPGGRPGPTPGAVGGGAPIDYPDRATARQAFSGALRQAANKFFRRATGKSINYRTTELAGGGQRLEFFTPANNPGYGKLYVLEVDADGVPIRRYKDTLGPNGLIERKWMHGGP